MAGAGYAPAGPAHQVSQSVSPGRMGGTIRSSEHALSMLRASAHGALPFDQGAFNAAVVRFVDRTEGVDMA